MAVRLIDVGDVLQDERRALGLREVECGVGGAIADD
jgi:hypothetical protein